VNSLKQSIFDWYRQNEKELKKSHASAFINCNKEQIILTYPSGFTVSIPLRSDFNDDWGRNNVETGGAFQSL